MADLKISELTVAGTLTGTELVPLVQSGGNKRATLDTVSTYARKIPQTAAELAAGVTPSDLTREPGDLVRYGLSTSASSTVNSAAYNNAALCNSLIFCDDAGTYVCDDPLLVQSNTTTRLAQSVVLQPSIKVWNGPFVRIYSKSNVRWEGGKLDGNKSGNPTGTIIGMAILDSSGVDISGVASNNFPSDNVTLGAQGDGFYIGGTSDPGSSDVSIRGCKADGNVRQGLSIARGEQIAITGCQFTGTTGNNPGGGIDIEGNATTHNLRDISITDCQISGCHYGIIFTQSAADITCTGCTITDCRFAHVYFADCTRVTMTGCVIKANVAFSASSPIIECVSAENVIFANNYVRGKAGNNANEGAGLRVLSGCVNLTIEGNTFENTQTQGVVVGSSSISSAPTLINVNRNKFINCVDPTAAANTSPFGITGNSGSGIYPLFVRFRGNEIYDNRSAGNEADVAIIISTSIPAATQAGYRIDTFTVNGPALTFASGVDPPLTKTFTWNPASLGPGVSDESGDITITGAAFGDRVVIYPPYDLPFCQLTGRVTATNTARAVITNGHAANTFDGANSAAWKARLIKFNEDG